MDFSDSIKIIITFISGGLAGNLVNQYINRQKEKKQPISIRKIVEPIQIPVIFDENHGAILSPSSKENINSKSKYENLFYLSLRVENLGNKDFDKFDIGIETKGQLHIFHVYKDDEIGTSHEVSVTPEISINNRAPRVSLEMSPLNRGDTYKFMIHLSSKSTIVDIKDIIIDSKKPVRLVDYDNDLIHRSPAAYYAYKAFLKFDKYSNLLMVLFFAGIFLTYFLYRANPEGYFKKIYNEEQYYKDYYKEYYFDYYEKFFMKKYNIKPRVYELPDDGKSIEE